jgi:hypothetical protein
MEGTSRATHRRQLRFTEDVTEALGERSGAALKHLKALALQR